MQSQTPVGGSRSRRWDLAMVAGLLLLGVGLPLMIGAIAGSLEIPRNDDWSYRRIALDLARTGRFALDGISETMIIGQILITQPFLWLSGLQPWAFTVVGVLFAAAGILSAYAMARCLLPAGYAALAAALLAIFPGYLAYATSYMSDVPALAAQFMCLACGALAIRHRPVRFGWLLASAALGVFAFSIREFAVAAVASVMLAVLCADPRSMRHWVLVIGIAMTCLAIHFWRSSLPGQLGPIGAGYGSIDAAVLALTTVAFVVSPAALVGAMKWHMHLKRPDLLLGFGLGIVLVAIRLLRWFRDGALPPIMNENLVSKWGAQGDYLVGDRPQLFSDAAWVAINVTALAAVVAVLGIGAGILGAHLRRSNRSIRLLSGRFGSPFGIVALFSMAVVGGLLLFSFSRPVFDRYFWPLVPPLAILFLYVPKDLVGNTASHRQTNLILGGCAMASATILASLSLVYLMNSLSFGAARWDAGEHLVSVGLRSDQIDAGYEWMGYHATSQGDPTLSRSSRPFYRSWWPTFTQCGLMTSVAQAPPDSELVETINYNLNLVVGPTETLYLYRMLTEECA